MTMSPRLFRIVLIAPALIAAVSPSPLPAAPSDLPEDLLVLGRLALKKRRLAEADQALSACTEMAAAAADEERLWRCWFYRGRLAALRAQRSAEDLAAGARWRLQAVEAYERARVINPNSGGILNNLAVLYHQLGDETQAADLFEQAIASGGEIAGFYARNYGDLLADRGDWDRAAEAYRRALASTPADEDAHAKLVAVYLGHRPSDLSAYLWSELDAGRVIRAEATALEALRSEKIEGLKADLLAIVAAALSRRHYEPASFAETAEAAAL